MSIKVKGLKGFENSSWFHHYESAIEMQAEKVLQCLNAQGFSTGGKSFWYLKNGDYYTNDTNIYLNKGIKNYGYVNTCRACKSPLDEVVLGLVALLNYLSKDTNVNWCYFVFKNNTSFQKGNYLLSVNVVDSLDDIVLKYAFENSSVKLYNSNKVGIQLKNMGNFENDFSGNSVNSSIAYLFKKCILSGGNVVNFVLGNRNRFDIKSISVSGGNDDCEIYTCKNNKDETMYLHITY